MRGASRVAIGVDVAARRGCDAVTLDDDLVARPIGRVRSRPELAALLEQVTPAVVAIDSPPTWAPPGGRRACERELTSRGISLFTTPDESRGTANSFYSWMTVGFEMFSATGVYPTFETFPHAVAVAIRGFLPATGLLRKPRVKREWRLDALHAVGVDVSALRTLDEIDAALCAYTGWAWTRGDAVSVGNPAEGQIILPVAALPDRYLKRS